MSSVPQPFKTRVEYVGDVGPVTVEVDKLPRIDVGPVTVAGIPSSYDISVQKLPAIHLEVDKLPRIALDIQPVEVSLRLKEIPSIRGHLPADFCVGLSVLGFELLSLRLCGEAQMITEPYRPNPCERCGHEPERVGKPAA
ncbi:MAG: hypothetical protein HYV08_04970 [Deltaproteobacteria bacterium]|nr:hypothetical protein [Deltaproteobacteria bacterium]MBI3077040.1 hypothetical protein [Deltaproteobacteria bacterium]